MSDVNAWIQVQQLGKLKQQMQAQVEQARASIDEEARARGKAQNDLRNAQSDLDQLRETLEEEAAARADLQRQLARANAEAQQLRSRLESEGAGRVDELEEARKKLQARIAELESELENARTKHASLEKNKQRLQVRSSFERCGIELSPVPIHSIDSMIAQIDVEDVTVELERSNTNAANLEKKQRGFDKQLADVMRKQQETAGELEAANRENRAAAAEVFRQRSQIEELMESIESLKRENKNLSGNWAT